MIINKDFKFSYKKQGTIDDLKNRIFALILALLYKLEDNKYSSSKIRALIYISDLKIINENLGYNYSSIVSIKNDKQNLVVL